MKTTLQNSTAFLRYDLLSLSRLHQFIYSNPPRKRLLLRKSSMQYQANAWCKCSLETLRSFSLILLIPELSQKTTWARHIKPHRIALDSVYIQKVVTKNITLNTLRLEDQ